LRGPARCALFDGGPAQTAGLSPGDEVSTSWRADDGLGDNDVPVDLMSPRAITGLMRLLVGLLLAACGSNGSPEGLPPATDWKVDDPTAGIAPLQQPNAPRGNPHEGVSGAPDLGEALAPAPPQVEPEEPIDIGSDEPVDPSRVVRGTLKLGKAVASRVHLGGVVYLMAKLPDAAGKPTGTAMAVDRMSWISDGQPFELAGATGEVLVIARYDQDEDGSTQQPGDILGMTRIKVPADDVVIELATIVTKPN